jgi:PAS domain S-box-containing protein
MMPQWNWIALGALAILVLYLQFRINRIRENSRRREELFQIVTENAADMIALVDMKGRRLYNSPAYKRVLGYSAAELGETSSFEQIHPDDRFKVLEAAREARSSGIGRKLDYRIRHKDGTWRILESIASAIRNEKGEVHKLVIVNRDVTERKLAERTTTATKEIAHMIKTIQDETKVAVVAMESGTKQVEEGVTSTTKAGDSLRAIIEMSEQVGTMITEMATAATQQSSTTEQVNINIEQIATLVKDSAIGAQQSATACQDLSGLALDLQTMVGKFRLEDGAPGSAENPSRAGDGSTQLLSAHPKSFAAAAR